LWQYLPEYREQKEKLLGETATKYSHRYGESVLTTWETSFKAVVQQSPMTARLLSLLVFPDFDDISLNLFIKHH